MISPAVATVLPLLVWCVTPLFCLGQPPILELIKNAKGTNFEQQLANEDTLGLLYLRVVWGLPCAIIAAGFPITRRFGAAMHRLGVALPSASQFAFAIALAVALVPGMLAFEKWVNDFWPRMGWPTTDTKAVEDLFKFDSAALAVAIGVTAGVTEELLFRGLLQPRIGLWFANLLFAAVHAFQYHWDGLLAVFLIGLLLGYVRRYTNTTCCIIIHGLYDCLLVLTYIYKWHWPWVGGP